MSKVKIIPAKTATISEIPVKYNVCENEDRDGNTGLCDVIIDSLQHERRRNFADNIMWSRRSQYKVGKFSFGYSAVLGFKKPDSKSELVGIDCEEARLVRRIFQLFLDGETYKGIARTLTGEGIETPSGTSLLWSGNTIKSILQNEKYTGSALLQKSVSAAYFSKKRVPNEGQVPQYFFRDTHKAIIDYHVFELVQSEICRRKNLGRKLRPQLFLSCRMVCSECGEIYKSELLSGSDTFWLCANKKKGNKKCKSPVLDEKSVKAAFLKAFNQLYINRGDMSNADEVIRQIINTTKVDEDIAAANKRLEALDTRLQDLIALNARVTLNQDEYFASFQALYKQYSAVKKLLFVLLTDRSEYIAEQERLWQFANWMASNNVPITNFNFFLWNATVDMITVNTGGDLTFKFKDGKEVTI